MAVHIRNHEGPHVEKYAAMISFEPPTISFEDEQMV